MTDRTDALIDVVVVMRQQLDRRCKGQQGYGCQRQNKSQILSSTWHLLLSDPKSVLSFASIC